MEIEDNEQEILLEQENVSVGGGAVNSVNGQVGDVVLTTSDLENTSDYQTGSEVESAISMAVGAEATAREQADTRLDTAISGLTDALATETTTRTAADANLQSQIDGITASSDVTDIVGTYAQLQAYDTSTLGDNDIIKVLQDESRNDETTYYRWSTATQSFTLIGEEGPYYTKSQADALLNAKQNTLTAGTGIDITNDVISATGGSGPTVVQSTGTSTTDVMSQNAVTSTIFKDPSTQEIVKIGKNSTAGDTRNVSIGYYATAGMGGAAYSVAVGGQAYAPNQDSVALGPACNAQANGAVAIGRNAMVYSGVVYGQAIGYNSKANSGHEYSVALGAHANTTRAGEVNIGTGSTTNGYNSTSYRVLGGVHDPVDDHDAATKGYVDTAVAGAGGSGVIELTSADYNWPTNNSTSIALWLLPSGVYTATSGTVVRANNSSILSDVAQGCFVVGYGTGSTEIIQVNGPAGNPTIYITSTSNGAAMTLAGYKGGRIITEGNLAQSTGTSTTDVMSQNATTSMVFADPSTRNRINIGGGSYTTGNYGVKIGKNSHASGANTIAIGGASDESTRAWAYADRSIALGMGARTSAAAQNSLALGAYSEASDKGEINIGTPNSTTAGYNNTAYRLITGVHDPQNDHDAANKEYVDTLIAALEARIAALEGN